jgi:hypothetical protein
MSSFKMSTWTISLASICLIGTGCIGPVDGNDPATEGDGNNPATEVVGEAAQALKSQPDTLPNGTNVTRVMPYFSPYFYNETAINHTITGIGGLFSQWSYVHFTQFEGAYTSAKYAGCAAAFANFNVQKRHTGSSTWVHDSGQTIFASPGFIYSSPGVWTGNIDCPTIVFDPYSGAAHHFAGNEEEMLIQIDTGSSGVLGHMEDIVSNDLSYSP